MVQFLATITMMEFKVFFGGTRTTAPAVKMNIFRTTFCYPVPLKISLFLDILECHKINPR